MRSIKFHNSLRVGIIIRVGIIRSLDKLMFIGQFADGTSAEFRVPEGRLPLDRGAAASAAASEGVASERSETRSPEPRVWYKY